MTFFGGSHPMVLLVPFKETTSYGQVGFSMGAHSLGWVGSNEHVSCEEINPLLRLNEYAEGKVIRFEDFLRTLSRRSTHS